MKILHLIHNYYPSIGGSQNLIQQLSEELIRTYNDEVTVLTTNAMFSPHASHNQLIPKGREIHNGVKIQRCGFNKTFPRLYQILLRANRKIDLKVPFRHYLDYLNAGPISMEMYRTVRHTDADVIASTPVSYLNSIYPFLSKKQRNTPYIIFGSLHLHQNPAHELLIKVIQKSNAYVAHTPFERDYLIHQGIDAKKIHVFGIGVDVNQLQSGDGTKVREKYHIGESPIVLFLGRHTSYKGIDTLIRSMRMVWSKNPDVYLVIAGSWTPYTDVINRMISELPKGEKDHVILTGSISENDKADLYNASNIFATVSSQESFGIVYLEAWACKKPVIGGRIGAVQSLINEGEDGLLVDIGNDIELSEKILYLLDQPEVCHSMGMAGYSRVVTNFTWPSITAKVRNLYQSLIDY